MTQPGPRRRPRLCRWLLTGFLLLYVAALVLFVIGHFGLFGSQPGPLSGIFLVPLGVPWIYLANVVPITESGLIWVGLLSPLINLVLIYSICRLRV
jgi:hypothetical protein